METTILWHAKKEGVDLTTPPDTQFNMERAYRLLREIMGPGVDEVFKEAWTYVQEKMRSQVEE